MNGLRLNLDLEAGRLNLVKVDQYGNAHCDDGPATFTYVRHSGYIEESLWEVKPPEGMGLFIYNCEPYILRTSDWVDRNVSSCLTSPATTNYYLDRRPTTGSFGAYRSGAGPGRRES